MQAWRAGEHSLLVKFVDGDVYRYTEASTGPEHLEAMRLLAQAGQGLATYISRHQPEPAGL